ncbi:MAG: tRNA pseudouridine(13) synthase TruD [Pseudomonadales bacterium]|nr:tRNA pseudouridine(13) synthase TruD [Pseudomonadales bacterium]
MNIDTVGAYAYGKPLGQAAFKTEPADFCVREELGFEPDGEGDHALIEIEKTGMNTRDLLTELMQLTGLAEVDIGYCGMKDKQSMSTQWFSLHLPGHRELPTLGGEHWKVLQAHKHRRKLKRGSHARNHFSILLRHVQADKVQLESRLQLMNQHGVPNYFGEQRMGYGRKNIQQAYAMLARYAKRPPRRLSARESMLASALRGFWFNEVLSRRIDQGTWTALQPGDVVMLDGRHSIFLPDADDADVQARLTSLALHLTGPLPGGGVSPVGEALQDQEQQWLLEDQEAIRRMATLVDQQRRSLRLRLQDLRCSWEGGDLRMDFALQSGSYATAVLRELVDFQSEGQEQRECDDANSGQ